MPRTTDLANFDPWDEVEPAAAERPTHPPKRRRPKRHTENDDYFAFTRRVLAAAAVRAGEADPEDFAAMVELSKVLDDAIGRAAVALNGSGRSWADIAAPLGITRQAALKRWGRKAAS